MYRKTHKSVVKTALLRPGVRRAYQSMEEEFSLYAAMIKARVDAGKTQENVAKEMGTTTSVVGRLESGGGKKQHSPTIATLQKYAQAVNCILQFRFLPRQA